MSLHAAFAAGFWVRPVGALGSSASRLIAASTRSSSHLIMGLSTFFVGLLPSYDSIASAPAASLPYAWPGWVWEVSMAARRSICRACPRTAWVYTSFIQTTATLGRCSLWW